MRRRNDHGIDLPEEIIAFVSLHIFTSEARCPCFFLFGRIQIAYSAKPRSLDPPGRQRPGMRKPHPQSNNPYSYLFHVYSLLQK